MTQQQLIWLGAALVALLGIAYLTGVFGSDMSTVEVPDVHIPAGEVASIRASGGDMLVSLSRENGSWRLTAPVTAPADSEVVARLLDDIESLALRSVVSTNPDRYGRYGVDSTATELTLEWPEGARSLFVGEGGVGSSYVRLDGDDAVYQTAEPLRVPESVDDWRDKTIFDIPPERIARVSVVGPERFTVLEREGSSWSLMDAGAPMQADSAAIQRYLSRLHPLRADGFVDAAPPPSDSSFSVRFELESGTERRMEIIAHDDDYAVSVDGGEAVFRVRRHRLDQLVPEAASFELR